MQLNMVVDACNPRTQEVEAEGLRVEANLDYLVRHCLKNISIRASWGDSNVKVPSKTHLK
jgi:hypothetical protein